MEWNDGPVPRMEAERPQRDVCMVRRRGTVDLQDGEHSLPRFEDRGDALVRQVPRERQGQRAVVA